MQTQKNNGHDEHNINEIHSENKGIIKLATIGIIHHST